MLCRKLMVRANDRPLEERPHTFDSIGMHIGPNILAEAMIDGLMAPAAQRPGRIQLALVRIDFGLWISHVFDELGQMHLTCSGHDAKPHRPIVPVSRSDNHALSDLVAST